MPDAYLHFPRFDSEIRVTDRGNRTWGKADTDAPRAIDGLLGCSNHFIEGASERRLCSSCLPHQNLPGHTATFGTLRRGRARYVIISDNRLHLYSVILNILLSNTHVHYVSRIVAVKHCNPPPGICDPNRFRKGSRRRGTEDFPHGNRIDQIATHIANESRLVTTATTSHNPNLVGHGCALVTDNTWVRGRCQQIVMRVQIALEVVVDNVIRVINDSLHCFRRF